MGMSLMVLPLNSEQFAAVEGDVAVLVADLLDRGWDADQLGWAAFALAVGVEGIGLLADETADITAVSVVSQRQLTRLVGAVAGVDRSTLEARFDEGAFGEVLGPEPVDEDREWLIDSAQEMVQLITDTASSGDRLVWIML